MQQQNDDGALQDIIAAALEARAESGQDLDVSALCQGRIDWQEAVEDALRAADDLGAMHLAARGSDPHLGRVWNERYRIDSRIGAGAMGVVYRARDLELEREVALKVLSHGLLEEEQARARFEREATALSAIRHDVIVRLFDKGVTAEGIPFLVMELVEGVSLRDVLEVAVARNASTSEWGWLGEQFGIANPRKEGYLRQCTRWIAQLAGGLAAAHRAGVFHRDIKPSNIIIREDGVPVLIDFGVAAQETAQPLTRSDAAVGTPAYMPPEALAGSNRSGPLSDVYGLAATLYHLTTLRPPYSGSLSEILTALATREPVPAVRHRRDLPLDVQAILDTGLARKVKLRYPSVEAMGDDLGAFLGHRPVSVRRTSPVNRVLARLGRSRAVQGALCAGLLGVGAIGAAELNTYMDTRRARAFHVAWAHVPASLCIVNHGNRRIVDLGALGRIESVLDAVVESRFAPTLAHALRASFRLDQGNPEGAAVDMESMAGSAATPYSRALAGRYVDLPASSSSALDLNLAGLPPLESAHDHFLSGFHALRTGDLQGAMEGIKGEGLRANRYSQELSLYLDTVAVNAAVRGKDWEAVFQLGLNLVEAAEALEIEWGSRSASTAHLISFGYGRMGKFGDALKAAKSGLALSKNTHVTFENASRCARALDRLDAAAGYAQAGIQLAPGHLQLGEHLIYARIAAQRFDEARQLLEQLDRGETEGDRFKRVELAATIECEAGLLAFLEGDFDASRELCSLALELLADADPTQPNVPRVRAFATALLSRDRDRASIILIEFQLDDPFERSVSQLILRLLPEVKSPELSAKVDQLLKAMVMRIERHRLISSTPSDFDDSNAL